MRECSDFEKSVIKYLTNKKTREEAVFLFLRDHILGEKYAISIQKNQKRLYFTEKKELVTMNFYRKDKRYSNIFH